MQYELRQQVIETQRSTFTPLIHRYGHRPATRYEEASVDIQSTENFHYRPLWDPEHEIYNESYSVWGSRSRGQPSYGLFGHDRVSYRCVCST